MRWVTKCRAAYPLKRLSVERLEQRFALDIGLASDIGNSFDDALELDVLDAFPLTELLGTIEQAFDRDFYRITVPGDAGDPPLLLNVSQRAVLGEDDPLDSVVSVFNAGGMLLASGDDSQGSADAVTSLLVLPGETYFIQAAGFYVSIGAYRVLLEFEPPGDDLPDSIEHAFSLALSPSDITSRVGRIDHADDLDILRFEAPLDGPITIALNALTHSTLDPAVEVRDSENTIVATDDNSGGRNDSFLIFEAVAGQTYYIVVSASEAALSASQFGNYALIVDPGHLGSDDFPGSVNEVSDILELNEDGAGAWQGVLERPGDIDAFQFLAPLDGDLLVRVSRFPGSGLFGRVEISEADGHLLASGEADNSFSATADLHVAVSAGVLYFVRVSGVGSSFGDYVVSVSPTVERDDYGDTTASAYQLNHPRSGNSQIGGTIQFVQDADVFRFTISDAGMATATIRSTSAGTLDASLQLVDELGNALGTTIEPTSSEGDISLWFDSLAGQIVYAFVTGLNHSTGSYLLEVSSQTSSEDDFSDDPLAVPRALIDLSPAGFGAQSGLIEDTTDADIFELEAPFDGQLFLRRARTEESALQSEVRVFDLSTTPVTPVAFMGPGDDTDPTGNDPTGGAETSFAVTAGTQYLVRVRSQLFTTGGYTLSFRGEQSAAPGEDGPGVDFSSAVAIPVNDNGQGQAVGRIDAVDDEDFYQFVAPVSGTILVAQNATAGSDLHNQLAAFSAEFDELANNEGHDGGLDALVAFQVTQGDTYYLRSGAVNGLGAYSLSLRTVEGGLRITSLGEAIAEGTLSAVDLVMELLRESLDYRRVEINEDSIEFVGSNEAAGIFSGGANILGADELDEFARGIILSTGKAANAIGPNLSRGSSQSNDITSIDERFQPLLDQLTNGKPTFDPAILAFDFVPMTNVMQIRFVFASEEYPEFVNEGFGDVFGVFVNGVNYARVPGTDSYIAGTGEVISIDTVNHLSNPEFFVDNSFRPSGPFGPLNVEYDGLTTAITLTIPVVEGAANEMVLVVADIRDRLLDSAVFVQSGSLKSPLEMVEEEVGEGLREQFTATIASVEQTLIDGDEESQHVEIHQTFLNELLKQLGVPLVGGFLVVPVDPVDYTLLTPSGTAISNATANAAAEVPNAFYSRVGTDELLVIPNAVLGEYAVQLTGVGSGEFRFGASYVAADGTVTTRLWQGDLSNDSRVFVLDFRDVAGDLLATTIAQAVSENPGSGSGGGTSSGSGSGGGGGTDIGGGIGSTTNPPAGSSPSLNLDSVSFAVATSSQVAVLLASMSPGGQNVGRLRPDESPSSSGDAAGVSGGTGDSALAADGSGAGDENDSPEDQLDELSRALDEFLREIGLPVETLDESEPGQRLREILRAIFFPIPLPLAHSVSTEEGSAQHDRAEHKTEDDEMAADEHQAPQSIFERAPSDDAETRSEPDSEANSKPIGEHTSASDRSMPPTPTRDDNVVKSARPSDRRRK